MTIQQLKDLAVLVASVIISIDGIVWLARVH